MHEFMSFSAMFYNIGIIQWGIILRNTIVEIGIGSIGKDKNVVHISYKTFLCHTNCIQKVIVDFQDYKSVLKINLSRSRYM